MIFLGGTIGANTWRTDIIIPALIARGVAEDALFNPVVEHWNKQAMENEDAAKHTADYLLYVLASPDPHGHTANVSAYSIVEATMHLYDAPERTVVDYDTMGMAKHTTKAMTKAMSDLRQRFPNAPIFDNYDDAIEYLASKLI